MAKRKRLKRSKTLRQLHHNYERIRNACKVSAESIEELAERLQLYAEYIKRNTMITHIEKQGVHCVLHQTLNGFMLKTSFNPFENMKFLEAMDKQFHVTGVENTLENGVNAVVFNTREYKTENILETIQNVLEETVFN